MRRLLRRFKEITLGIPGFVSIRLDTGTSAGEEQALVDARGRIDAPKGGEVVDRRLSVSGCVEGIPDSAHLWLAIEIQGACWPKGGELQVDEQGGWEANVFEGGRPESFDLALYAVTERGHETILAWLRRGHRTGEYPGLPGLPHSHRLDLVAGLRLK